MTDEAPPKKKRRRKKRPPGAPKLGRPPLKGQIRLYAAGNTGEIARFVMTHDILERLIQYRDSPLIKLHDPRYYRMTFGTSRTMNMPACLLVIERPTFDPRGPRITRVDKSGNLYQTHYHTRRLNLKPRFAPMLFNEDSADNLLWIPDLKGVMMIFPDHMMDNQEDLVTDRGAMLAEATL